MLPPVDLMALMGPILLLVVGALATLVAEPFLSKEDKHTFLPWIGVAFLALAGVVLHQVRPGEFGGMFALDPWRGALFGALLLVSAVGLSALQRNLRNDDFAGGEPYVLLLLATVGIGLMLMATHFIALFMGMEIASLAIYPMVGFRRDQAVSNEAVLKYFSMGAVFSAVFLMGTAMIYGATGGLGFATVMLGSRVGIYLLGYALVTVGLLFKLGVVPFHFWSPDAYGGAPSGVVSFMAGAVKIGAVAVLANLWSSHFFGFALHYTGQSLPGIHYPPPPMGISYPLLGVGAFPEKAMILRAWQFVFVFGGVASVVVGSLALLGQTSVRRMMAYSGVANAGFLALALGLFVKHADARFALYYVVVYALGTSGVVAALAALSGRGDIHDDLASLVGTGRRRPLVGLALTVLVASVAGLPFTAGFVAKFQLLAALFTDGRIGVEALSLILPASLASQATTLFPALPVFVLLCALISVAGYFRLVVAIWTEPATGAKEVEKVPVLLSIVLVLCMLAIFALAIQPRAIGF
ncbi:MAG TPA: NADH-quinone oxidoreductase subunit N [Fibrobacteria bacterium]|nr:NADH-quinone oxidoreductase subunit N [Fibrobacteria bacterium]